MSDIRIRVSFAVSRDDEQVLAGIPDGPLDLPQAPRVISGRWTPNQGGSIFPTIDLDVPYRPGTVARPPVPTWVTDRWAATQVRAVLHALMGREVRVSSDSVDIQIVG